MAGKLTPEIEDELLSLWQQRRKLSEKSICTRFGIGRSTLRIAVKRALNRRHAVEVSKLIDDREPSVG